MPSRAYYNEFCPKAAAWLRELIKEGLIAPGDVDERSITDVLPSDLHGYTQCHFFAGIGGWSYALRLAGVPDDQPIWTGSCPCQPFSTAGKQLGTADERHLWPSFARLIQAKRPTIVFGEQVASAAGRAWLAGVFADLEGMAYYRAAADLCAAGVTAPHIRQRIYWMAYSDSIRGGGWGRSGDSGFLGQGRSDNAEDLHNNNNFGMADTNSQRGCGGDFERANAEDVGASSTLNWERSECIHCRDGKIRRIPIEPQFRPLAHGVPGRVGLLRGYGNAIVPQVAAQFIQAAFEAIGDHDGRSDVLMDDPAF